MLTYIVNLEPAIALTTEQFWQLCLANPDLRPEHSATEELIIRLIQGGIASNGYAGYPGRVTQER